MTAPVFLRGDGVTLHPVEAADADFLARIRNDPDVRRGLTMSEPVRAGEDTEYRVDGGDDREHFLVRADGERVGVVDLVLIRPQAGTAEIGYFFAPEAWGNGYATAAAEAVADYAFAERRLRKLTATAFAFNEASMRVLEKVGFTREGTRREQGYVDGDPVDMVIFGLLAREYDGAE